MEELEEEAVQHFKTLLKHLCKLDSTTMVLPWKGKSFPLVKESNFETRETLENYVDRLFLKTGMFVWSRMRIGFNVSPEKIFEDEGLSGYQMTLTKEPIQEKYLSTVGWFLGSTKDTNTKELRDILNSILPKDKPIDLRYQAIKMASGETLDMKNAVRAIHIYAAANKVKSCYYELRKIYGTSAIGYPLGKVMRIVPVTSDPRTPVTPKLRAQAHALKNKQKVFAKNIRTMSNHYIQSLDLYIEACKMSFRQAVMSIKTSVSAKNNLFIATDTDYTGNVVFTFHKDYANEAISIIPVLPVYLAHLYGPRAWGWFNADAKSDLQGYYFDESTGEILSHEGAYTEEILQEGMWMTEDDLKTEGAKLFEFSLSEWFINSAPNKTNAYNDNGTVKSGVTVSFAGDVSASTGDIPTLTSTTASSAKGLSTLTQE